MKLEDCISQDENDELLTKINSSKFREEMKRHMKAIARDSKIQQLKAIQESDNIILTD